MVLSPGKGTGLDPPRARSRPSQRESDQVSPGPPVAVKQSGTAKLLPDLPTGKQDALPIIRGRPVAAPALPVSPPSRRPRVRTACTRCKLQPLSISENARPEHSRPPAPRAPPARDDDSEGKADADDGGHLHQRGLSRGRRTHSSRGRRLCLGLAPGPASRSASSLGPSAASALVLRSHVAFCRAFRPSRRESHNAHSATNSAQSSHLRS